MRGECGISTVLKLSSSLQAPDAGATDTQASIPQTKPDHALDLMAWTP
jgi:hypothetical protein